MNVYEQKAHNEYKEFWANDRWYYSIELKPGQFTKGFDFPNVALTRHLLNRLALKGADCLDISAADGLISLLRSRQGATKVGATDRNDFSSHFLKISENMDFD
jgi:2-polyprenyl-3-methyl-5-hydroxy-6-metoxy-1,4-benzoquinol methylase